MRCEAVELSRWCLLIGATAMNSSNNTFRRGLPWFRLYAEIVDDPKLRLLSFEDRWHFVAILALKCSGVLDGAADPGLLYRMVAVKLGVEVCELEALAKRLAELFLVDAENLQPVAWERRQAPSDSSRDRTREWRVRRADGNCHGDAQVTFQNETEKERDKKKNSEKGQCKRQRLHVTTSHSGFSERAYGASGAL